MAHHELSGCLWRFVPVHAETFSERPSPLNQNVYITPKQQLEGFIEAHLVCMGYVLHTVELWH